MTKCNDSKNYYLNVIDGGLNQTPNYRMDKRQVGISNKLKYLNWPDITNMDNWSTSSGKRQQGNPNHHTAQGIAKFITTPPKDRNTNTCYAGPTHNKLYTFETDTHTCHLSKRCGKGTNNYRQVDYTCYKKALSRQQSVGKTCPDITIHNSKNEWDVIHGDIGTTSTIQCNDGYSFNHDLQHQGGDIYCTTVPNIDSKDIKGKQKWYVKDDDLEHKCNKKANVKACHNSLYNPYVNLYNHKNVGNTKSDNIDSKLQKEMIPIGCVWDKNINKCIFRKSVENGMTIPYYKNKDKTKKEPVCKALRCKEKSIPFSDKDKDTGHKPLPGPTFNNYSCVKLDGTYIEHIDTAHDCLCHQHKSCNTCAYDHNCKWCSKKDEGNKTDKKSGCYSKNSHPEVCHQPKDPKVKVKITMQKGGGTCLNTETRKIKKKWKDIDPKDQTSDACESEKECVSSGSVLDLKAEKKNIEAAYIKNKNIKGSVDLTDRELCESYNNKWNTGVLTNTEFDNHKLCYYNKNVDTLSNSGTPAPIKRPIGFTTKNMGDKSLNISIKPWYCESIAKSAKDILACAAKKNRSECVKKASGKKATCKVVENLLDDTKIRWSHGSKDSYTYKDKVLIYADKKSKCCLNKKNKLTSDCTGSDITELPRNNPNFFTINQIIKGKYIDEFTYNGKPVTIDPKQPPTCKLQYIVNSKNNNTNTTEDECKNIPSMFHYEDDAERCINPDGYLYCKPPAGAQYCDLNKKIKVKVNKKTIGGTIDNFCPHNSEICKQSYHTNANAKSGTLTCSTANKQGGSTEYSYPKGDELTDNFKSNCTEKRATETSCSSTGNTFKYGNKFPGKSGKSGKSDDKHYGTCENTSKTNHKIMCELLRKTKDDKYETVHWGSLCNDTGKKGVPEKILCEQTNTNKWLRGDNGKWNCYDNNYTITKMCQLPSKEECIITYKQTKDIKVDKKNMQDICEKWEASGTKNSFGFKFHVNKVKERLVKQNKGVCKQGVGKIQDNSVIKLDTPTLCEANNYEYKKKYKYNDTNFCGTQDSEFNKPDEHLNWTNGGIQSDNKDNWKSECNPTISSTCHVKCNPKYGGGGDYVCKYNNHSEKVCDIVTTQINHLGKDKSSLPKLIKKCNKYTNCAYNQKDKQCKIKPNKVIKGQMEWMGPECYKLNNDAFHQGIKNYPKLDEFFPPLIRLITLFIIIILIVGILYITRVLKITGKISLKIIYTFMSNILKGGFLMLKNLVLGCILIVQGIINYILSGKYLVWGNNIHYISTLLKWGAYGGVLFFGYSTIELLWSWGPGTGDKGLKLYIDNINKLKDYITKGYSTLDSDIDDIEKDMDEIDTDVMKKTL